MERCGKCFLGTADVGWKDAESAKGVEFGVLVGLAQALPVSVGLLDPEVRDMCARSHIHALTRVSMHGDTDLRDFRLRPTL